MSRTSFGDRETARGGENVQGRDTVDHPLLLRQLISHPVYIRRAWAQRAQVKSLKLCPKMEEPENQTDCLQNPGPSLFLYSSSQTTAPLFTCFEHVNQTSCKIKKKKRFHLSWWHWSQSTWGIPSPLCLLNWAHSIHRKMKESWIIIISPMEYVLLLHLQLGSPYRPALCLPLVVAWSAVFRGSNSCCCEASWVEWIKHYYRGLESVKETKQSS